MTKFNVFAVFIILIIGVMVIETQGVRRTSCDNVILHEVDCGVGNCSAMCMQKLRGTGQCIRSDDKDKLVCLCVYNCRS
ncbi:hypothetical protein CARUB_v10024800mg [Capsella rubella]|uniref:Knottin scorpion toxin-like domain-containing protein n=1 Tax=Capsella rubella TaxID=81985 RepID=R0FZN7_9BRAS|nr:hypothetical protein CARUB_v10024800mg [Capsella rubella]